MKSKMHPYPLRLEHCLRVLENRGKRPRKAKTLSLDGLIPESWLCIDCAYNTAPSWANRLDAQIVFNAHPKAAIMQYVIDGETEIYAVRNSVWPLKPQGGCLCIGCLEKRIKRRLKSGDFIPGHPFNVLSGTKRLLSRRPRRARPQWTLITKKSGIAVRPRLGQRGAFY